jgi:glycosyltransferase involved in cell wall biosynthesis
MIFIDVSSAVHGRAGLGRYSENLARALYDAQPERYRVFYNRGRDGRLPESLCRVPSSVVHLGYKPWRTAVLLAHLGRISFRHLVRGARLFHSTEHLLMPLRGIPAVLTVHDLIYRLYPAYHKRLNYWYLNLAMPIFCRRAAAIIAVSQATKRDIIAQYAIDPAKIHVVYEAAAPNFRPPSDVQIVAARKRYHLPDHYLIHLSTIEPRKNLRRLVEALKQLRRTFPGLCLILAGSKGWLYDDLLAFIEGEGLRDSVRLLGWVPDADLPAVIAGASLAVQPSLYEGFGLPVLEHMASGQVVAASNSSSHPEIGGEAAAYFDPFDGEEIVSVISRLLADREEYEYRRRLGLAQAGAFSWERAAGETAAVYDGLLEET